ncbi:MAG: hypothetical protein U0414_10680 [Polyangiaceae bacterium]
MYDLVGSQQVGAPGIHVIGSDATGQLVSEADTDSEGRTTLEAPVGGAVSALLIDEFGAHLVSTVSVTDGVVAGIYSHHKSVAPPPPAPCGATEPFQLTLDVTDIPPTTRYVWGRPWSDLYDGKYYTLSTPPTSTPPTLPAGKIDVQCALDVDVLFFDVDYHLIGRANASGVSSDDGAPQNLTLPVQSVPQIQQFDFSLEDVPDGFTTDIVYDADGVEGRMAGGGTSSVYLEFPSDFHPFHRWKVLMRALAPLTWVGERTRNYNGTEPPPSLVFDVGRLAGFGPAHTDWTDPERPTVVWTLGDGAVGDGISLEAPHWTARVAAASGALQFPVLTSEFEAWKLKLEPFAVELMHVDVQAVPDHGTWIADASGPPMDYELVLGGASPSTP